MAKPKLEVTSGSSGLRIEKMRKSYRKRVVIRDVSMELNRGEVVALLGPNGSGKTTSFYTIAGLVFPEAGRVTLDGQNVTSLPMYRRARMGIGYLPQEMSIFRGLSVEDNISAVLDIAVSDDHKRRERLEELLSDFSIEHLRRAPALALSGGGNAAGWRSHAALRLIQNICFLMSLLRALTRFLSATSGILWRTLRRGASAF